MVGESLALKGPLNLSSMNSFQTARGGGTYANKYLKLIKQTTLGNKDTIIELPPDIAIYNEVFYTGNYSPNLTKYIAQFINFYNVDLFIDLGANCGLVTRGIVNQLNKKLECILVEPFPDLMRAIKTNLSNMENGHFVFKQFALSNFDGEILFYREINNSGSGTMNKRLGSMTKHNEFTLPSRKASSFFTEIFAEDKKVVIKSDLQGYDAEILSMVPKSKIRNILLIVLELWSNPEIKPSHVHKFLDKFENEFSFYFLNSELKISRTEVEKIWLDGDKSFKLHKYGIVKDLVLINNKYLLPR
jgi:FkbM family methyltransferase